jgi:hypothetical protein
MIPVLIPCSRSAHDQNVLVRRPQGDQHGYHSDGERQASLEGSSRRIEAVDSCCTLGENRKDDE